MRVLRLCPGLQNLQSTKAKPACFNKGVPCVAQGYPAQGSWEAPACEHHHASTKGPQHGASMRGG